MNRFLALEKIIELGSFTKAAQALGYTQSSISQMMQSLETEYGIQILNRSKNGVSLTLEGQQLYPIIEQTIRAFNSVQEKATEIKGLDTGVIRVGTVSSITCHWLPQLIKTFTARYPHVDFVFYQGDYNSIQNWIKTGVVDFGFTSPAAVTGIQTIELKQDELLAVLSPGSPLATKTSLTLTDLSQEPFILLEEGHFNEPLRAFEHTHLKPHIRYRIHDDYGIMTMVEAGLGISILPKLVLQRTHFNIVTRSLNPILNRDLAIGFRDTASLPIASRYFIDEIVAHKASLL